MTTEPSAAEVARENWRDCPNTACRGAHACLRYPCHEILQRQENQDADQ